MEGACLLSLLAFARPCRSDDQVPFKPSPFPSLSHASFPPFLFGRKPGIATHVLHACRGSARALTSTCGRREGARKESGPKRSPFSLSSSLSVSVLEPLDRVGPVLRPSKQEAEAINNTVEVERVKTRRVRRPRRCARLLSRCITLRRSLPGN